MIRIERFTSVDDIPIIHWNTWASRDAVNIELAHLLAVEESGINDIHPYYFVGYSGNDPIGIAYCFSTRLNFARLANSYSEEIISTVHSWKPDFMDMRIVEVGHIASLGTSLEASGVHFSSFLQTLANQIDDIAIREKADLCFFRDIDAKDLDAFSPLKTNGYHAVLGYPFAVLQLKWTSFEEYLASLKAKRRRNIRHRRLKLQSPEITVEKIGNYGPYAVKLTELWTNMAKRQGGYEHERLTPAFFESMSRHLKDRSFVVAIKRGEEIIAFGLYLVGDKSIFGMAEGLDYQYRDQYDLYANTIFEGIQVACELGKSEFNIGITTYGFKTFIGADIDPRVYFVKSAKNSDLSAVYADQIKKSITLPTRLHRPFRMETDTNPSQPVLNRILPDPENTLDPFAKHYRYLRADTVRSTGLYAFCPVFEGAQEPVIRRGDRDVIMLGTNSYLGLATHPSVKRAAREAIEKYGSGCSGSPMMNGTLDLHEQLASELRQFIRKPEALVFSTGYQTNIGVVSTLVNRNDVLIMDQRNHASLIDGARLSGATIARYKHNNMAALEAKLRKYAHKPKLIVTDSLFSMEGTMVNLPELVYLAKKYQARLMLDESHAIGVIGPTGRGVAEYFGLLDAVDVIMGTFSKSFASIGGFIAGDRKIIDTLKHTARSHLFSASLPPSAVAVVLEAIRIIDSEPDRRKSLTKNARFMADGLKASGYQVRYDGGAIIPIFCGDELLAMAAFHQLLEEGVFVNPVTCPAVPKHQEILRVSLMATHNHSILQEALSVFRRVRTSHWPRIAN